MRDFFDLLTFDERCVEFGEKLGYSGVLCGEVNYCEPRSPKEIKVVKGKLNVVKGGPLEVNQAAVRNRGVAVLLEPVNEKAKLFDTATARMAQEHGVAIGFSLASVLGTTGVARARLLRNFAFALRICRKMGANVVLVSGAANVYGMRAPQDLASLGTALGLSEQQALWALSEAAKAVLDRVVK